MLLNLFPGVGPQALLNLTKPRSLCCGCTASPALFSRVCLLSVGAALTSSFPASALPELVLYWHSDPLPPGLAFRGIGEDLLNE